MEGEGKEMEKEHSKEWKESWERPVSTVEGIRFCRENRDGEHQDLGGVLT